MKSLAVAVLVLLAGCSKKEEPGELDFSGLTAEQVAKAKAQATCPVSDEPLGSMGPPIEVEGAGAKVFLCCKGCLKKFHADPAKYVAKAAPK
jgi:hypothetical protein